jgi:hypothetical protein
VLITFPDLPSSVNAAVSSYFYMVSDDNIQFLQTKTLEHSDQAAKRSRQQRYFENVQHKMQALNRDMEQD